MMDQDLTETKISSEEIYDGVVIHLFKDMIRLPNGKTAVREVIRHPGAVCVLPLTEENEVIFVKQFRYAFNCVTLEVPAGKLEKGEGDSIEEAALRELSEETGFDAKELIPLGDMYTTPALIDEVIHLFAARGLTPGKQHTDEDEFINVCKMPLREAVEKVMRNEIPDSKTQTILLKAAQKFGGAE